jgi:hypothetical protein
MVMRQLLRRESLFSKRVEMLAALNVDWLAITGFLKTQAVSGSRRLREVVIAGSLALLVTACRTGLGSPTPVPDTPIFRTAVSNPAVSVSPTMMAIPTGHVHEAVTTELGDVLVNEIQRTSTLTLNPTLRSATGEFLDVQLSVKNTGRSAGVPMTIGEFRLTDQAGRAYAPDLAPEIQQAYLAAGFDSAIKSLAPGTWLDTFVIFDVGPASRGLSLSYAKQSWIIQLGDPSNDQTPPVASPLPGE